MQWFSRWTAGVCCAAIGCAVLELLHPSGAMEKPMRYVLALFFLAALALPLSDPVRNVLPEQETVPSEVYNEVEALMQEQTVRLAETQLASVVQTLAAEAGAEPEWVEISVGQDHSGQYKLKSICICLPEAQRSIAQALSLQIEAQMGTRPEFSYASQGGL